MAKKEGKITYTCPECDSDIQKDAKTCPGCGMEIEWETSDFDGENVVDEILEELEDKKEPAEDSMDDIVEGRVATDHSGEAENEIEVESDDSIDAPEDTMDETSHESEPADASEKTISLKGSRNDVEGAANRTESDEGGEDLQEYDEEDLEDGYDEEVPIDVAAVTERKVGSRTGTFTAIGVTAVLMTVISLMALLVLMNYDTWVKGEVDGSIGDQQLRAIYTAIMGVVLFGSISAIDALRNRSRRKQYDPI
jgi:hypothetical protein